LHFYLYHNFSNDFVILYAKEKKNVHFVFKCSVQNETVHSISCCNKIKQCHNPVVFVHRNTVY
jgi:hypothetical protein